MAELEELQNGLPPIEDAEVEDEAVQDDTVASVRYDITSFGIDFDVEGIVRRLRRGEIFIPEFQRNFIWNLVEASRFVESLLLGLPIPGIFLAQDSKTGKLLVIDGQQRLKTLRFFYDGVFNPSPDDRVKRVFRLTNVQKEFEGSTYATLSERDRITLDNSVIHATIVRQEAPPDGDTSMYHIFERLTEP